MFSNRLEIALLPLLSIILYFSPHVNVQFATNGGFGVIFYVLTQQEVF